MKKYSDIITLPHHVSQTRAQMPVRNRAAQFAPFAALMGYDNVIAETARATSEKPELSEEMQEIIDLKLKMIVKSICENPKVSITYFVADKLKSGGAYECATGCVKRVDDIERTIIFMDGRSVSIPDICSVEGEIFQRSDSWI